MDVNEIIAHCNVKGVALDNATELCNASSPDTVLSKVLDTFKVLNSVQFHTVQLAFNSRHCHRAA